LVITFDEAEAEGEDGDASACCNEKAANTPNAGGLEPGPGGGKIGAVLVSPYIEPGTVVTNAYNHYSLLRTIEDLFGLDHLGYAESPNPGAFGADVFTRPQGLPAPRLRMSVRPRRLEVGEPTRLRIKVDQRARVRMRGVCGRRERTTNRRGRLTLRHVVARRKGRCRFRATRRGYRRATKRLRAR
jgi:phosphatidylinositol-3-phosphatase